MKKKSIADIARLADEAGMSYGQWVAIHEPHTAPTKREKPKKEAFASVYDANREEIKMRIEEGESVGKIAADLGVSRYSIFGRLKQEEWYEKTKQRKFDISEEELRKIAETHTISQACALTGFAEPTLRNYASKYKIRFVRQNSKKWNF